MYQRYGLLLTAALALSSVAHAQHERSFEPWHEHHRMERPTPGITRAEASRPSFARGTADAVIPIAEGSEGDEIKDIVFSSDGEKILVTHRLTNNVTVFDAETYAYLGAAEVGTYPIDITATGEFALVACHLADEAWIIDLETFDTTVVPTHGLPAVTAISPDGRTGYVGTALLGDTSLEAIDLATGAVLWSQDDYVTGVVTGTIYGTNTNRGMGGTLRFAPLLVLPDGRVFAPGYNADTEAFDRINLYAPGDGAVTTMPAQGPIISAEVSNDGSSLVYIERISGTFTGDAVRRALPSLDLLSRVTVPGLDFSIKGTVAPSESGDKALFEYYPVGSLVGSVLVRFDDNSWESYLAPSTFVEALRTVRGGNVAVVAGSESGLYDFDTETFTSSIPPYYSADKAAISPTRREFAITDFRSSERLSIAIADGDDLVVDTTIATGDLAEPDAPYRIALLPDQQHALVSTYIPQEIPEPYGSKNALVALVDLATQTVVDLIEVNAGHGELLVSPDGRWALSYGFFSDTVDLIDLDARLLASTLDLGGPFQGAAAFAPDSRTAYLSSDRSLNGGNDLLHVLGISNEGELTLDAAIPAPGIGTVLVTGYLTFGTLITRTQGDLAVTPDGGTLLLLAPDAGGLHVIDTVTETIVQTLDLPHSSLALTLTRDDLAFVAPFGGFSDRTCAVVRIDGASSTVVATPECATRVNDVAYDPGTNRVLVASLEEAEAMWIDVDTGAREEIPLDDDFRVTEAAVRLDGAPLLLGWTYIQGSLYDGALLDGSTLRTLTNPLTGVTALGRAMAYSATLDQTFVTIPGPDELLVYNAKPVAAESGPGAAASGLQLASANPTSGPVTFEFKHGGGPADLAVFDRLGRRVAILLDGVEARGEQRVTWDPQGATPGVYLARLTAPDGTSTVKFTVLK